MKKVAKKTAAAKKTGTKKPLAKKVSAKKAVKKVAKKIVSVARKKTVARPAARTTARARLEARSKVAARPVAAPKKLAPKSVAKAPSKTAGGWTPPAEYSRAEVIAISDRLLAQPDIPLKETEDIIRIHEVGLDWDMGMMVYEPKDPSQIARGADGKKIGIFLLHGGSGDYKSMEAIARLYAGKFGHKAVAMTFPGRHYFDSPTRDWPGDTINKDGTVRTPIWLRGEHITPDQYEVVTDDTKRMRYGVRTVARAKPGTKFYDRMAGWLPAFETGMKEAMRKHFPEADYSIYVTGHSTGGPHVFMMCQRVPNIAGVIAVENSPFGFIQEQQHNWSGALGKVAGFERVSKKPAPRTDPFDELYIRTWRDRARYAGPEALGQEGPSALMRLPWLMEEIMDWWNKTKMRPQFKAEYILTHNIKSSLRKAAEATATRLGLSGPDKQKLIERYLSLPYPVKGGKPVPPVLFGISKDSRDHSPEVYEEVVLPMFRERIDPAPRVAVTRFGAGVHVYTKAEKDLPLGIGPAVAEFYHQAITGGYFLTK
ncbi:MAG TPA: hypothetical protein VFS04_08815 [Alphaproteobacteria bacterium]|nr:hypothetical protein [Alphaproteobacteria bacterium]